MTQPVEYQTPLPMGRNLRFHELPDGLRVTREVVSRFSLWREALVPVLAVLALIISTAALLFVIGLVRQTDPRWLLATRIGIVLVMLVPTAWIIRQSWQNGGVVTDIAVSKAGLYWRKQNLWGSREHIWPLNTITLVSYDPNNRSLKVQRLTGMSLNAFAFFRGDELDEAAIRLSAAIDMNREAL